MSNRNYATDYVVHAYNLGAHCAQRTRDRVASEVRSDVTCKRCLASLAKRDREFQRKARRHFREAERGAIQAIGRDRLDELMASMLRASAARAIAREEGETQAHEAAAYYVAALPGVHTDVTVRRVPDGWVAYDWVARRRIFPAIAREEGRS